MNSELVAGGVNFTSKRGGSKGICTRVAGVYMTVQRLEFIVSYLLVLLAQISYFSSGDQCDNFDVSLGLQSSYVLRATTY